MSTINDIVPKTVRRSKCADSPCPTELASAVEQGALYFSPGGVHPAGINGAVLIHAVSAAMPGTAIQTQLLSLSRLFRGHPPPKLKDGPPVDSLHSIRGRKPHLDVYTTNQLLRNLLQRKVTKKPSTGKLRIAAMTHADMKTCQHRFHTSNKPAVKFSRVAMCAECWRMYRFKRAGHGRQYYARSQLRNEGRLWAYVKLLFSATEEAYCGYIAACKAQTAQFAVTPCLPVDVLEEIGLVAMLYPWAVLYPMKTYSAVRMLHSARPAVAASLILLEPVRADASRVRWWRTAEERGWVSCAARLVRKGNWASPIESATEQHAVAWSKNTLMSVAAIAVVAAVRNFHPDMVCTLAVEIGPHALKSDRVIPAVKVSSESAVVMITAAQSASWAFVWRCLCRAKDAADAMAVVRPGRLPVRLVLIGNPLAAMPTRPTHPAWMAVAAGKPGDLIPAPTGSFFSWCLGIASTQKHSIVASPTLTPAGMYPASQTSVAALVASIESGFPVVDDTVVVDAGKTLYAHTVEAPLGNSLLCADVL